MIKVWGMIHWKYEQIGSYKVMNSVKTEKYILTQSPFFSCQNLAFNNSVLKFFIFLMKHLSLALYGQSPLLFNKKTYKQDAQVNV